MEIKSNLISQKFTKIFCEDEWNDKAPSHFNIRNAKDDSHICDIHFQEGSEAEGINGVNIEDLLIIVSARLSALQNSEMRCTKFQEAIMSVNEAIMTLR